MHSLVRSPRKTEADTPNQAGTKQHTSLSVMGFGASTLSAFQIATDVICIPG